MTPFRKKLFMELGIGIAITVPLLGGSLFFSGQIGEFGGQIVTARKEMLARTDELNAVAALRADYNDGTKRNLETLYAMVPEKDQLINLSRDFQTLSTQARLISSFTFLGETPAVAGGLGSFAFRLNLRGQLDDLFSFFGKFEKFRYLSALSSFSVLRGEKESEMLTQGSVFYRQP
ncbi:MAG: hypothetical protein V1656_01165 [Candidatus Jorgensenbacteria bacterium]